MPRFLAEDIDIDIDEFLGECSSNEIDEVIDYLIEYGYIKKNSQISGVYERCSIPEQDFEDALNKLHGKYRTLSTEEEEIIKIIAKRF